MMEAPIDAEEKTQWRGLGVLDRRAPSDHDDDLAVTPWIDVDGGDIRDSMMVAPITTDKKSIAGFRAARP
jgi:hypothetical protein